MANRAEKKANQKQVGADMERRPDRKAKIERVVALAEAIRAHLEEIDAHRDAIHSAEVEAEARDLAGQPAGGQTE